MASDDGSDRSRLVALIMAMFLGLFGVHRFYVGKTGSAIAQIFTLGGLGIWTMYDVILIAAGSFRDADGRRVVYWFEDGSLRPAGSQPELTGDVLDEIDQLRAEVAELAERVDFTERLLTRARQPDEFSGA